MRTTSPELHPVIDPGAHRRHLGVAALALWLAAIGAIVLLWATAATPDCRPSSFEGCVVEDVRR